MSIKCFFNGIKIWFKYGVFIPHLYKVESFSKVIIIADKNSFRVSNTFEHNPDETVYPNAMLIKDKCIYCGKIHYSWTDDWDSPLSQRIRREAEE